MEGLEYLKIWNGGKVYWRRDGWWEYINPESDDGTL